MLASLTIRSGTTLEGSESSFFVRYAHPVRATAQSLKSSLTERLSCVIRGGVEAQTWGQYKKN